MATLLQKLDPERAAEHAKIARRQPPSRRKRRHDAAYRKGKRAAEDVEKAQQAEFVAAIHKVNDWVPLLDTSISRWEANMY